MFLFHNSIFILLPKIQLSLFLMATPTAYGSFWARGQIGAAAKAPHCIHISSSTYATACGNAGSLPTE